MQLGCVCLCNGSFASCVACPSREIRKLANTYPDDHALGNKFERPRGFLELISRFEFDFRWCVTFYFLNDSNFWCVQSSITHTMWPNMCLCCGLFVRLHNSNSNVAVSLTIHDDTEDVCKNMKPLRKVKGFFYRTSRKVSHVQIVRYTWVLVANDTSNHPVADSLRSVPQESWSRTTSSGKAND